MENFKDIEPTEYCPPHLQRELVAEIDTIRNGLRVVEVYAGDFLKVISTLFSPSDTKPFTDK